jgi:hypothetical protein
MWDQHYSFPYIW